MVEGKSYKVAGLTVRQYNVIKYLNGGQDFSLETIDDIGEVTEDDPDSEQSRSIVIGDIDSVISEEDYVSCKTCKSKLQQIDEIVGQCPKCDTLTKISKCPKVCTAKVIVGDKDGKDHILTIFDPLLSTIVDGISGTSLGMKLLNVPTYKFFFDTRGIIFAANKI